MDLWLLDKNFRKVEVIDTYISFIWTDRYMEAGDFSLTFKMNSELLDIYKEGYYLSCSFSKKLMIIEDFELTTNVEDGDELTISGRSLESILDRRIVWNQTIFNGDLQNAIERLLNDAIISPSIADRAIDNFIFLRNEDERIADLTIDTQYTGDNLYEVISNLCKETNIGFEVLPSNGYFVFHLFIGEDRSHEVIFSPEFGNLQSSDYKETYSAYRNVALVAGEGEGAARRTAVVGEATGLDRKEMYVDARNVSSNSGAVPATSYVKQLQQQGEDALIEAQKIHSHFGDIIPNVYKSYGIDYQIGDFVTFMDSYGFKSTPRVDEYIYSDNTNEIKAYPTFNADVDKEEVLGNG